MESKEEIIKSISRRLMRIINKQGRIEEIPVRLGDGIEVTPTESHTIQAIGQNSSINITDLGAHFGVTTSAASQIAAKLTKKGFVQKTAAEHNCKELRLKLTPLGWRAFEAHENCHGRHLADIAGRLDAFSLSQVATALVLLEVIEDTLDERLAKE